MLKRNIAAMPAQRKLANAKQNPKHHKEALFLFNAVCA